MSTAFSVSLLCGSLLAQSPQNPTTGTPPQDHPTPASGQPTDPSSPTQANSPAATPTNNAPRISPGSVLPVRLTKGVDAKKAKKGDEVVATVTQDMQNNAGTVIVPKDTKVVGHVTEVQPRNKEQKESQLAIAFDQAVLKSGEQMQMPMSIQAIIAPPSRDNAAAGAEPASNYPGPASGGSPSMGGGRSGNMGGTPAPTTNVPQSSGGTPTGGSAGSQPRPQVTGNTQGVVGFPNLTLSTAANGAQGSLVTSEKNNVKLDDGTMLLLRVN